MNGAIAERLREMEAKGDWPIDRHFWFVWKKDPFDCCIRCGVIRRKDGKESKCRGWVRVALRDAHRAAGKKGSDGR